MDENDIWAAMQQKPLPTTAEQHEWILERTDDYFAGPQYRMRNAQTGEVQLVTEDEAKQIHAQFNGRIMRPASSGQINTRQMGKSFAAMQMKMNQLLQDALRLERTPMIGLDYETYCEVDLPKRGLDQYVNHPSFRVLLASIAFEDGTVLRLDFVADYDEARRLLSHELGKGGIIAAHNAGFERAVTRALGINVASSRFRDSAVVARCHGFAGKLEHAAAQMLPGKKKMDVGTRLIKKFSMGEHYPTYEEVRDDPDWILFGDYCDVDAELSLEIMQKFGGKLISVEHMYESMTQDMNDAGWHVDLKAVQQMLDRYEENKELALQEFRAKHDPEGELNFASPIQLNAWCQARGVNTVSLDEEHVDDYLRRVRKQLEKPDLKPERRTKYEEVIDLLETKRVIGGSSLKKLQVILNTTGPDGRLRNQYMHVGAGQTFRTSGRGVQMQNLKRLSTIRDMNELYYLDEEWTNDDLAENLRQVFTATHPKGKLIVGDFSSVEARGLAYLAGQEDTINEFHAGKDLYKVQAAKIFDVPYSEVTKEQRRTGKVGVLACGYQAGGGAVQSFAKGMGVEMTEAEAVKLVSDWRAANPMIVQLWEKLDALLGSAVDGTPHRADLGYDLDILLEPIETPASLKKQHPGSQSIAMKLRDKHGDLVLYRVFHGCYRRGRSICYYKPEAKNGELWSGNYTDPKTKRRTFYSIYGGKLSGILTQSMCREIFFRVMRGVDMWVSKEPTLTLIGQFHDELVFDWDPSKGPLSLTNAIRNIEELMSDEGVFDKFPLAAEVKADYRYTK